MEKIIEDGSVLNNLLSTTLKGTKKTESEVHDLLYSLYRLQVTDQQRSMIEFILIKVSTLKDNITDSIKLSKQLEVVLSKPSTT